MKKSVRSYIWKLVLCTLTVSFSALYINAQTKFEAGISLGPSNFLGDLGGRLGKGKTFIKDNNFQLTRFMPGIFVSVAPNEIINFRLMFNIGKLEGADSVIKGKGGWEEARRARNQHFKSPLLELFVGAEFYPTAIFESDPTDLYRKLRPYGLIGVGVFHFNPKAQYVTPNGRREWVELKPLRTEGQGMANHPDRKEYSLTQMNVPYGVGVKYFFNEKFNLSLEIVNRITFTDYIDDVSTKYIDAQDFYDYFGAGSATADIARQMANKSAFANGGNYRPSYGPGSKRGNPNQNDSYYSTTLKFGIRLGADPNAGFLRGTRCPVVRF
jgi:Domain of unknown function (DUF6089)